MFKLDIFIKIQKKEKSFQYLMNLIEKIGLDIQKSKRVSEDNIIEIAWIVQKTNPDLSISLIQDLLKLNPDNLFLIIQLASIYDSNGYTDKAITLLENVLSELKKEGVDYQYFVFLGSLYEKRGNIEKHMSGIKRGWKTGLYMI
jgi:tetratricopeptide (TPR) repeat protein